jgi:hypothetical protein
LDWFGFGTVGQLSLPSTTESPSVSGSKSNVGVDPSAAMWTASMLPTKPTHAGLPPTVSRSAPLPFGLLLSTASGAAARSAPMDTTPSAVALDPAKPAVEYHPPSNVIQPCHASSSTGLGWREGSKTHRSVSSSVSKSPSRSILSIRRGATCVSAGSSAYVE